MQRVLLLALSVALAAAVSNYRGVSINENIFRPGVEYQYRYETQVVSGIRTTSDQVSGVKICATVKVQCHRDGSSLLKMQHITISQVNDVIPSQENIEMLSDEMLTRLTGEQAEIMTASLLKPVKFRFEEGEIRDVKSSPSDKYWSVNIKKGLLSLLQLKLTGKSSFSESDSFSESYKPRSRFHEIVNPIGSRRMSSRQMEKIFKVMESDVNGDCETKYFINSEKSMDASSVSDMTVTKVKNFDNCNTKNTFESGLFAGLPHFSSERKLVQPSYEAEYLLSGDRHHFLIRKATVQAKYLFRPYGHEGGQISTQINQHLRLVSTEEIQTPITGESFISEKHGLKMEIPRGHSWQPENAMSDAYRTDVDYKELIDVKLNEIISVIYPVMQENSAAKLMQLNLIVRHVPRRQLLSIVKSYLRHESGEGSKKCEILLDILPTIQNPEVAEVLIELIRDGSIHGIRAQLSLGAMALTVKPSPRVVTSLLSLYREGSAIERRTPHIRQSILLSVGTICNKMINTMRRVNKPIPELITSIEEISVKLITLLEESNTEADTIRVLKAIGNTGSKEFIAPVKSIVDNKNQPTVVRQQAIFALRKLAKHFDKTVHPILTSVIMDTKEPKNLRISAFVVLKRSNPTYTTLELIGHRLRSEPSSQVKTFIYSSLVGLANRRSTIPEIQETAKNARKVLKVIHAVPVGLADSRNVMGHVHSENLDLGAKWDIWSIKSKYTGLPKTMVGSFDATVFGTYLHLIEGGIEGNGVETTLRRLFGPYGLLKNLMNSKATWNELLRPLSGSHVGMLGTKLSDFLGRKTFETREEEEIKGLFYGELLGHEMFYRHFDKESVEELVRSVMSRGSELIMKLKEGINVDSLTTLALVGNSLVIPTPMGVPVSLNVSAASVLKVQGHIRATSLPGFRDFVIRRPYMSKKFEIEANIKPSCSVEVYGYMGADLRWLRTGTALKANFVGKLPIKGHVSIDPVDSKLTIKYDPPQEEMNLFKAKVEPVTFTYHVPTTIEKLPFEFVVRPIRNTHVVKNVVQQFDQEYSSGFRWRGKMQWTVCKTSWCPSKPLDGKHEISLTFEPVVKGEPKEFVLKIQKFTHDIFNEEAGTELDYATHGSRTSSQLRNYRLDRSEPSFDYEGFEPVTKDEFITSPRQVELLMEFGYSGYRGGNKLRSKVTWITQDNYLQHQLNVQVVGVVSQDMPRLKLMFNGMLKCPVTLESYSHYVKAGDLIGKLDVSWGSHSFNEYSVKSKLWKLDNTRWDQELHSEDWAHYSTNVRQPTPFSTMQYGLEVEFPHITYTGHNYLVRALDIVKKNLERFVMVGIPENIPTNKIVILGQLTSKPSTLSFIIKTPRETDFVHEIPMPSLWDEPFYRPSLHDVSPWSYYRNTTEFNIDELENPVYDEYDKCCLDTYSASLSGVCMVHSDKMVTFDGTPILLPALRTEMPSSQCDILLAQDCSRQGSFSVTGSYKNGRWSVKTLIPNYHIELTPEWSGDKIMVKINGEERRMRTSSPFKLFEVPVDTSSSVIGTIEITENCYKLNLREIGLTIILTQNNQITIKVAPWSMLQGRLCGLCGNHNYDYTDDMTSMTSQPMYSSKSFVMDSVLPSSYCDVSDYESQLSRRHEGFCKKQKTIKVERTVHGVEQICFSKNPVTVCRKHCITETTAPQTVRFACLPRDDMTAENLLSKYHSGLIFDPVELEGVRTVVTEEIELPQKCTTTRTVV